MICICKKRILAGMSPFHVGVAFRALSNPNYYLCVLLTTAVLILPVAGVRYFWQDTHPTLADKLRSTAAQPRLRRLRESLPLRPLFVRATGGRRSRKNSLRSGYAFAHSGGFGELITRGKFWRNMDVLVKSGSQQEMAGGSKGGPRSSKSKLSPSITPDGPPPAMIAGAPTSLYAHKEVDEPVLIDDVSKQRRERDESNTGQSTSSQHNNEPQSMDNVHRF
jgi:hypothetical protein